MRGRREFGTARIPPPPDFPCIHSYTTIKHTNGPTLGSAVVAQGRSNARIEYHVVQSPISECRTRQSRVVRPNIHNRYYEETLGLYSSRSQPLITEVVSYSLISNPSPLRTPIHISRASKLNIHDSPIQSRAKAAFLLPCNKRTTSLDKYSTLYSAGIPRR